ncbi:MAG: hypothetical protein V4514_07685 [Pseudomonadota bacterium]|uniref:hypothetical protein n=1 Tax=Phenylobacterium sp. TaxID=1871053 RepID=UPI0025DE978C|nr:hypothetical protein [Phenylobacterium sp.]MBT9471612.1 hypothetical protein [Phenylobacterium sp.]
MQALITATWIVMMLSLIVFAVATRALGPEWLKWVGVVGYVGGSLLFLGLVVVMFVVTVLRLPRADQFLLNRLDAMWEEEWRTITRLAPGRFDEVATRARWLKLRAHLLDRTAVSVALTSALVAGAATLLGHGIESKAFAPWLEGESLARLQAWINHIPAAIGCGMAISALYHHRLATKLSRVEFLISEAALAAQALALPKPSGPESSHPHAAAPSPAKPRAVRRSPSKIQA